MSMLMDIEHPRNRDNALNQQVMSEFKIATWMPAAADGDGDGIVGIPMAAGGPLSGMAVTYRATLAPAPKPAAVPVPAAVWLVGSGLLGLAAGMRRRKQPRCGCMGRGVISARVGIMALRPRQCAQ